MILAQLLNLLYNVVDRIYIGRIPEVGTTALTGVGLCFPIISLITAFTYLYGNGGAPLCSMERGKGNDKEAEHLMGNAFTLLIGTGIVLTIIGLIFISRFFICLAQVMIHSHMQAPIFGSICWERYLSWYR